MSIEDGDWFREDYRERERKYGGDFSLHSTPKKQARKTRKAEWERFADCAVKHLCSFQLCAFPVCFNHD